MYNGVVKFTGREFKEIFNLVCDKDGSNPKFDRKLFIYNSSLVTVAPHFSSKISVYEPDVDGGYFNSLEGFPNCCIKLTDMNKLKVGDCIEFYVNGNMVGYSINSDPSDNIATPLGEDSADFRAVTRMIDVIDGVDSKNLEGSVCVFPPVIERVSKILTAFGVKSAVELSFSPMKSSPSSSIMRGSVNQTFSRKSATTPHARVQICVAATTVQS